MKKMYLLIQEKDEYGHCCAHIWPVTQSDNILRIDEIFPDVVTVNVMPTKKEAYDTCTGLNKYWRKNNMCSLDFMPDGTPAPF